MKCIFKVGDMVIPSKEAECDADEDIIIRRYEEYGNPYKITIIEKPEAGRDTHVCMSGNTLKDWWVFAWAVEHDSECNKCLYVCKGREKCTLYTEVDK